MAAGRGGGLDSTFHSVPIQPMPMPVIYYSDAAGAPRDGSAPLDLGSMGNGISALPGSTHGFGNGGVASQGVINGGSIRQPLGQMHPNARYYGALTSHYHLPGGQFVQQYTPNIYNDGVVAGSSLRGLDALSNLTQSNQVLNHFGNGAVLHGTHQLQTINANRKFYGANACSTSVQPYSIFPAAGMFQSRGPMLDLLHNVSMGSRMLQKVYSPSVNTVLEPLDGVADANPSKLPSVNMVPMSEHEDSGVSDDEIDDEEDYHEADDEGSEELTDKETTVTCIPETPIGDTCSEEDLEFEMYPVTFDQYGVVTKRRRFPKGYEVPDYRPARDVGAIEKAMRIGRTTPTSHIFEPRIGMVFDSRIEAYKFYNLYSWEVGFGVRFGSFARNRVNKMRTMQKIVCERQGFDSRVQSRSKRCRCKVMIILHRTEDMGWYVSKHVSAHNHELSVTCGEKREWNSHSKIEPPARRMIKYLRESNVSLTRCHVFLGKMFGGMNKVPFNHKSLRSVCSEIARDQKDCDMTKTLEMFRSMKEQDPGFQFTVDVDSEKKVKTLLWTSGKARSQYNFFGDAITFDTTYCTNIYNMPFGMFVGVNNHFQTILFGGVLMKNEDAASFAWVFREFLVLMGGKAPVTILTDQCKAMTKAIREVFTEGTTHLWCKWHVLRDAPQEIGPLFRKNLEFQKEFNYIINHMLTIDEFERGWHDLINRYELHENEFMQRTFSKREKWAKPWARNTFCARMASTQRSESANMMLKNVVPTNSCMNRFVEQYRILEFLRTAAEQKAEHQTKQFVHRTKRMYAIEKHALSVYTKNSFGLFTEEVDRSANYVVKQAETEDTYFVIHNRPEMRKGWARVVFYVKVEENGKRYSCECGQYEHFGILCCHAIKVMITKGLVEIPEAHILKRWTRNARDFVYPEAETRSADQVLGQNIMFANALDVVNSTDKNPMAEKILLKHLSTAKKEIALMKASDDTNMALTDADFSPWEQNMIISETDDGTDTGYESNRQITVGNTYGASGSSAYMSDADIMNIQAPIVPPTTGRRREKRFKRLFERKRTGWKKYKAIPEVVEPVKNIKKPKKACIKKIEKMVEPVKKIQKPKKVCSKKSKSAKAGTT